MANATLKFDDRELRIGEDLTTIGRASDNTISFSDDSNISRYHVEIENRGGGFYLIELGSSNGTTVNGERIMSEKMLEDGDVITLGNSSVVEFKSDTEPQQKEEKPAADTNTDEKVAEENPAGANKNEIAQEAQTTSKFPTMLAVAGATCGLAVIFVVGAVLFSFNTSASGCQAKAKITNLESFDVLRESKELDVELDDETACVSKAIFLINGKQFAESDTQPFTATLDPNKFATLANGENNSVKVALVGNDGKIINQPDEILLVFETKAVETPKPVATQTVEIGGTPTPKPTPASKGKVTPAEAQTMIENLIKSMGGSGYQINKEFIEKVLAKTNDYATTGGFSTRAQGFQDIVKTAFTQNTDVGAPLGFLTAMNRTQFNQPKEGAEVGLWRMSNDFATQNSLTSGCGTETLADLNQNCAAKASAIYTKALLRTVFEGDPVYTAAAYGMPLGDAYEWKKTLSGDRKDFWNVIKTQNQRDELVKFFAAGIVADNPQTFGLKDDKPISSLY
ncbi:hypothetical protein BH10ACI1_BH10ACI1_16250 [soil metagenome]